MADKFLLISVILTLVVCGEMKAWVALLILSRDLLILGVVGGGAYALKRPIPISPIFLAKFTLPASCSSSEQPCF